MKAERRRSTYERYSNFTLPVLPEEKTPVSSPVGTLKGASVDIPSPEDDGNVNAREEQRSGNEVHVAEKPIPPKKPDFVRVPSKVHIGT